MNNSESDLQREKNQKELEEKIQRRLTGQEEIPKRINGGSIKPISIAFPPCSDVLLSNIKDADDTPREDDITKYFDEYFIFKRCSVINDDSKLAQLSKLNNLDENLLSLTSKLLSTRSTDKSPSLKWPSPLCLPPSIVSVEGIRRLLMEHSINLENLPDEIDFSTTPLKDKIKYENQLLIFTGFMSVEERDLLLGLSNDHLYQDAINKLFRNSQKIRRLFIADLVWLFYFERMGLFKILGVILDDFAIKGKYPLANDDLTAIILEAMVRQTKMGMSSTVRDRNSSYRRCIGWNSESGSKLSMDTTVNTGFNTLFHKFIQNSLEYYKYRRLADVIEKGAPPSVATLITVGDTIDILKKAFRPFSYGRNYSNTLSGIVWTIAAMDLVKRIRTILGIPQTLSAPHEFIPAAYDILVLGRPITPSETNRYLIHKECGEYARDILLDLEVLDYKDTRREGELQIWLDLVESKIEGYRTAYRILTGVDIGMPQTPGTPKIDQAV